MSPLLVVATVPLGAAVLIAALHAFGRSTFRGGDMALTTISLIAGATTAALVALFLPGTEANIVWAASAALVAYAAWALFARRGWQLT